MGDSTGEVVDLERCVRVAVAALATAPLHYKNPVRNMRTASCVPESSSATVAGPERCSQEHRLRRVQVSRTHAGAPAAGLRSVHAARGNDPLAMLAGDCSDEIEICVVMKHAEVELLSSGSNQKIRDLAPALAAFRQRALHLERSADVRRRRLDGVEGVECTDKTVPLVGVTRRITDLEVADGRARQLPGGRQRFDHPADIRVAQPLQNAGINQKPQRHASERSWRWASASTSSAEATCRCRRDVARRRASFTVSLIVVVPSSARAALRVSSSTSMRCFATSLVYTL
jgi:hypothetical protein